jgi:hypothetical protein
MYKIETQALIASNGPLTLPITIKNPVIIKNIHSITSVEPCPYKDKNIECRYIFLK